MQSNHPSVKIITDISIMPETEPKFNLEISNNSSLKFFGLIEEPFDRFYRLAKLKSNELPVIETKQMSRRDFLGILGITILSSTVVVARRESIFNYVEMTLNKFNEIIGRFKTKCKEFFVYAEENLDKIIQPFIDQKITSIQETIKKWSESKFTPEQRIELVVQYLPTYKDRLNDPEVIKWLQFITNHIVIPTAKYNLTYYPKFRKKVSGINDINLKYNSCKEVLENYSKMAQKNNVPVESTLIIAAHDSLVNGSDGSEENINDFISLIKVSFLDNQLRKVQRTFQKLYELNPQLAYIGLKNAIEALKKPAKETLSIIRMPQEITSGQSDIEVSRMIETIVRLDLLKLLPVDVKKVVEKFIPIQKEYKNLLSQAQDSYLEIIKLLGIIFIDSNMSPMVKTNFTEGLKNLYLKYGIQIDDKGEFVVKNDEVLLTFNNFMMNNVTKEIYVENSIEKDPKVELLNFDLENQCLKALIFNPNFLDDFDKLVIELSNSTDSKINFLSIPIENIIAFLNITKRYRTMLNQVEDALLPLEDEYDLQESLVPGNSILVQLYARDILNKVDPTAKFTESFASYWGMKFREISDVMQLNDTDRFSHPYYTGSYSEMDKAGLQSLIQGIKPILESNSISDERRADYYTNILIVGIQNNIPVYKMVYPTIEKIYANFSDSDQKLINDIVSQFLYNSKMIQSYNLVGLATGSNRAISNYIRGSKVML